jgi:hypothetical protein
VAVAKQEPHRHPNKQITYASIQWAGYTALRESGRIPGLSRNIDRDALIYPPLAWHRGGRARAQTIAHEQKKHARHTADAIALRRRERTHGRLSFIVPHGNRDPNQKLQHSRLEEVIKHDSE